MKKISKTHYKRLVQDIGALLAKGRRQAFHAVDNILVHTYWQIGRRIIEHEQCGEQKAEYGSRLLTDLSKDLKREYGKGFSKSNIYLMRLFYLKYEKFQTVSGKLSWSHYAELLSVSDDLVRSFYKKQCVNDGWSVRELKRQRNSGLFERIALSKDKKGVLKLSQKGQLVEKAEDVVKNPYVFEFLNIPEHQHYSEKDLEQRLINNLGAFLLELGKGFAFIGNQYRITIDNTHYYVDLVFYHRILKCFVLVDLKLGKVNHQDIGQMNLYLNYFKAEENAQDDSEPIGIVIGADKNEILVNYATGSISNKLFVSRYQLYIPDKKMLEQEMKFLLSNEQKEEN